MRKEIIIIGPLPPPYYGQSLGFFSLKEELTKEYFVYFINIQPKFSKPGVGFNFIRVIEYIFSFLQLFFFLYKSNKDCKVYITVAQSSSGFYRDFLFILISSLFSRKIFAHLKGGNFENFYKKSNFISKYLIKFAYKKVFKIIILGKLLKNNFNFSKTVKDKIVIVENGLTNDDVPFKKKYNPKGHLKILFLSNLIISKGYLDLLESLFILEKNKIKFQCVFAGEIYTSPDDIKKLSAKELKKNFLTKIASLKDPSAVKFLGQVHGEKKYELLKKSDIFVLPTYYLNEGQPISIIEAMAFKNTIITTKFRSIPDLIKDKEECFFVKTKDPSSIANILSYLNLNRDILKKTQEKCYEKYKNNFTRKHHLVKMMNILD